MGRAGSVSRAEPPDDGPIRFWARHERLCLGLGAVALFVLSWEAVGRSGLVNPLFLSSPTAIGSAAIRLWRSGELGAHLRASGTEFLLGYLLAAGTALPLGLAAGWYRRLHFALDPFLSAFYATPRVVLLPLILLWLGIGLWSKVAVVALSAFFHMCITTISGVRTVDPAHLDVARAFGARDLHVFRTLVLPSCVPFLLAACRLGVGRALLGVVVAELYGASAGIGFMIDVAGATFQTDTVFVGIAVIAAFGVLCDGLLVRIERRFEAWRPGAGTAR